MRKTAAMKRFGKLEMTRSGEVRQYEPEVPEQRPVVCDRRLFGVGVIGGRDFLEHVRMTADRALAEDDQAAGEDVGTFDSDRYRNLHVRLAEEIARAHAD